MIKNRTMVVALGVALAFAGTASAAERMLEPDDARLVDVVRLIESGISGSQIAEQVRQTRLEYELSGNDVLYLQQNGARESTIAALMATSADADAKAAPAAPAEDPMAKLKELGELHQNGVLTDEEFAAAKAQILGT